MGKFLPKGGGTQQQIEEYKRTTPFLLEKGKILKEILQILSALQNLQKAPGDVSESLLIYENLEKRCKLALRQNIKVRNDVSKKWPKLAPKSTALSEELKLLRAGKSAQSNSPAKPTNTVNKLTWEEFLENRQILIADMIHAYTIMVAHSKEPAKAENLQMGWTKRGEGCLGNTLNKRKKEHTDLKALDMTLFEILQIVKNGEPLAGLNIPPSLVNGSLELVKKHWLFFCHNNRGCSLAENILNYRQPGLFLSMHGHYKTAIDTLGMTGEELKSAGLRKPIISDIKSKMKNHAGRNKKFGTITTKLVEAPNIQLHTRTNNGNIKFKKANKSSNTTMPEQKFEQSSPISPVATAVVASFRAEHRLHDVWTKQLTSFYKKQVYCDNLQHKLYFRDTGNQLASCFVNFSLLQIHSPPFKIMDLGDSSEIAIPSILEPNCLRAIIDYMHGLPFPMPPLQAMDDLYTILCYFHLGDLKSSILRRFPNQPLAKLKELEARGRAFPAPYIVPTGTQITQLSQLPH